MPFPFLPVALGAASFFGGMFGNKKRTSTSTTTPTLDPKFGPLQDMLLQQIMGRLKDGGIPKGYETGQIGTINNTFDQIGKAQDNNLTARGLGTSPIAGNVDATRDLTRGSEIVRMQREIPQMARQNQLQDLLMAQGLLGQGRGSTSTQTDPGNPLAGGMGDLASMLGFLLGQGKLGGGASGLPGMPVNIGGLG